MYWKRINKIVDDGCQAYIDVTYKCSKCGAVAPVNEWYMYDLVEICPNCGEHWSRDEWLVSEMEKMPCSET